MQAITDTEAGPPAEEIVKSEARLQPPTPPSTSLPAARPSNRVLARTAILSVVALCALAAFVITFNTSSRIAAPEKAVPGVPDTATIIEPNLVRIDEKQTPSITIEPVSSRSFLAEKVATGKIGFNEDVMTPVFSPYTGRIVRLLAKPGDAVNRGTPLLEIDTPDLVQVGQDLITASLTVPKAKTVLELATRAEDRQHRALFEQGRRIERLGTGGS